MNPLVRLRLAALTLAVDEFGQDSEILGGFVEVHSAPGGLTPASHPYGRTFCECLNRSTPSKLLIPVRLWIGPSHHEIAPLASERQIRSTGLHQSSPAGREIIRIRKQDSGLQEFDPCNVPSGNQWQASGFL